MVNIEDLKLKVLLENGDRKETESLLFVIIIIIIFSPTVLFENVVGRRFEGLTLLLKGVRHVLPVVPFLGDLQIVIPRVPLFQPHHSMTVENGRRTGWSAITVVDEQKP